MVSNNIHIQFHAFAPLALNLGTGKAKHCSAQKVPSPIFYLAAKERKPATLQGSLSSYLARTGKRALCVCTE
jgi:hypothetical protein